MYLNNNLKSVTFFIFESHYGFLKSFLDSSEIDIEQMFYSEKSNRKHEWMWKNK